MTLLRWIFWESVYLFRREPREFGATLLKMDRTRKPWWKFKPHVRHNKLGKEWEVWLDDETTYVKGHVFLMVDLHVTRGDNLRVVGLTICDESLKAAMEPKTEPYELKEFESEIALLARLEAAEKLAEAAAPVVKDLLVYPWYEVAPLRDALAAYRALGCSP